MTDRPPEDPSDHAVDFSRRWADRLDRYAAERMEELGVPPAQIGSGDHTHGIPWCAFNPHEKEGGGVSPGGRINVDSGVFNPDLLKDVSPPAHEAHKRARLRDRIDASIAHEFEEARAGSHGEAVASAPDTALAINDRVRAHLRAIEEGEIGRVR